MSTQIANSAEMTASANGFHDSLDYVSVMIGDQILGLPIGRVHDVFITHRITAVPCAPPEIVGLINLRGRVVTAICLRKCLDQPPRPAPEPATGPREYVAVGIDVGGEAYALIVDAVGEVMHLSQASFEAVPANLDRRWSVLATGVHRLNARLLVVLDVDAVLRLDLPAVA